MQALGLLVSCLVAAGCGPSSSVTRQAEVVAVSFHRAIGDGEGADACSQLTEEAARNVEETSSSSCDQGVLDAGIDSASSPLRTDVYGREARVMFDSDIVLLTHTEKGWRIDAAGCTYQGDAPYDCQITGG